MSNKFLIFGFIIFSAMSCFTVVFYENIVRIYHVEICQCNCETSGTIYFSSIAPDCSVQNETTQNITKEVAQELEVEKVKTFLDGLVKSVGHLKEAKKSIETQSKEQAYFKMILAMNEVINSFKAVDNTNFTYLIPDIKAQHLHKLVVCPEIYKGTKFGWPFYDKGFENGECNDVEPLNDVVQILINTLEYPDADAKNIVKILKNIQEVHKGMTVHLVSKVPVDLSQLGDLHVNFYKDIKGTPGQVWNFLISKVTTPYFLLARDIYYFHWYARITRMLRIASAFDVKVVAGSGRDVEGRWRLSCQQQTMRNYTLRYIEGYDVSRNACLVCDYAPGPFVAKTDFIKHIPFDEKLPDQVVFEDFFIRLKRINVMVMTCPDSMYFMLTKNEKYNKKEAWIPLARKWGLNRLHLHDGQRYQYSCEETGISCQQVPGVAIPPCCLEKLAKTLQDVMKKCEEVGAICELSKGYLLGAIQFDSILPWTREDNIVYVSGNHSAIQTIGTKMKELGYKWSEGEPRATKEGDNKMHGGHFDLESGVWHVSLDGKTSLSSEYSRRNNMVPTKLNLNGVWVQGPHNPVQEVRTLYGDEIFKHNEEYNGNLRCQEKIGSFCKCPQPLHHACLDRFADVGNAQFKIP